MNKEELIEVMSQGVYKGLKRHINFFSYAICAVLFISWVYSMTSFGKDSTDPTNGRSGLIIRVDNKTNCEYLESSSGGLTPRLNSNGKQLGCKP